MSASLVFRATARPVCEALDAAMRTYGVPEQILTDNGKVFTSRYGRGRGEVLFDRICRENGVRHLLTAPSSPTTTGKVERFHKTIRREFLRDRIFSSIDEAQGELDVWVDLYNRERPHQGIGMVSPAQRFALVKGDDFVDVLSEEGEEEDGLEPSGQERPRVLRKVDEKGKVHLLAFEYHVGRFLAGETVEVEIENDGLLGIFHRGVLVATHARRHPPGKEPAVWQAKPRSVRPKVKEVTVLRTVDPSGNVSFAGTGYRVGNGMRGKEVQVTLRGDTVQITYRGQILRTHHARHDRAKEHGAFANPGGRPRKEKAS